MEPKTYKNSLSELTKRGMCQRIYSDQKHSSKARGHNPPAYTKEELTEDFDDFFDDMDKYD